MRQSRVARPDRLAMSGYDETTAFSSPLGRRVGYGTTPSTSLRSAAPAPRPPQSRVVHHVQPSDTIQGISLKYNVTVEELRRVNKLWANDSIWLRGTLLIPAHADATAVDEGVGDQSDGAACSAHDVASNGNAAVPAVPAAAAAAANSSFDGTDFLSRMDSSLLAAISHLKTITAAESAGSQLAYSAGMSGAELQQRQRYGGATAPERRSSNSSNSSRSSRSGAQRDLRETPEPVVRTSTQDQMERLQDELFQL